MERDDKAMNIEYYQDLIFYMLMILWPVIVVAIAEEVDKRKKARGGKNE